MPDTCHSRQLVLKRALADFGGPELELVQRLLVTGTKPEPSLANFVEHSKRFASRFTEEERRLNLAALSHLGYAPQRFDSRSKPLGRHA